MKFPIEIQMQKKTLLFDKEVCVGKPVEFGHMPNKF